jgi:RNA polymerase sporulation-specific sigma factor
MANNLGLLSDEQLVRLAQADDQEALEFLIRKYMGVVKGKKHSYFIMGAEDDDVVQEGTIGLLKAIRGYHFDRESSFASFAELCINRQILSAIKAANRKKHAPLNTSVSLNQPIETESNQALEDIISSVDIIDPEAMVILEELIDHINRNEDGLFSPLEIKVWSLYMQGKSYANIALELGKSSKAIYNAMERAKKKILASLAD